MNEAWARILRLEAGNPAWLERVEAAERKHRREIQETLERLRNAPRGKTLNELFRVGERRRARPEVGYDEVPLSGHRDRRPMNGSRVSPKSSPFLRRRMQLMARCHPCKTGKRSKSVSWLMHVRRGRNRHCTSCVLN